VIDTTAPGTTIGIGINDVRPDARKYVVKYWKELRENFTSLLSAPGER
jgi:hypothetical protein